MQVFSSQDNVGWSHKQEGVSTVQQEGNPLKFPFPSSWQRTDGSHDLRIFNSPSWDAEGMFQLRKASVVTPRISVPD